MNASVIDPATWTEFGIIDPDLEKVSTDTNLEAETSCRWAKCLGS